MRKKTVWIFRVLSHQLYGDTDQHLEVRAAGILYLRDNPEIQLK